MPTRRGSLYVAIVACLVGGMLWADDDLFTALHLTDHDAPLRRLCGVLEFFFMVPGAAALGWVLSERLRRSREELAQAEQRAQRERLVVLGRLSASLAHEVRNPLHNLRLLLEEARQDLGVDELRRLQERADANITRIDRAVDLVYRLARPRMAAAGEETCDLAAVVADAVAAERQRSPAVALRLVDSAQAMVACQKDDARTALDNLLRNATAAGTAGVDIAISGDRQAWEVLVANEGVLPEWVGAEDDSRAVSAKPGGLGLGLSISRQLISEVGGTLRLAQVGSRVEARLRLPRAPGA